MKEKWQVLNKQPNYEVSTFGRVRSLSRETPHWRGGIRKHTGRQLVQATLPNGYKQVTFGDRTCRRVHRLVAETFIQNSEQKPCVNHKDGDKSNNRLDNLEWCTFSENKLHSYKVLGEVPSRLGKFGAESKVNKPVLQIDLNGNLVKEWDALKTAEREGNFDSGSICRVCKGRSKTHKGYKWKYKN